MSETNRIEDEKDTALRVGAEYLEQAGFSVAPEFMRAIADGKMPEYVQRATEAGVAAEKERLERHYAAKRACDRLQMQMEYEIALALKGSGLGGWNSQGEYTIW